MKKLTLQLDDLRIESFDTDGAATRGGTVNGAQALTRRYEATCVPWECYAYTEPGFGTYGGPLGCVRCG